METLHWGIATLAGFYVLYWVWRIITEAWAGGL